MDKSKIDTKKPLWLLLSLPLEGASLCVCAVVNICSLPLICLYNEHINQQTATQLLANAGCHDC